jgi:uncharacterized protein YqeY
MTDQTLLQTVNADLATAMRARDQETLGALRMLKTALTNKRVELARDVGDLEALQVVSMLVKQRRDSIEQFTAAGRDELADKERRELAILERYLPPPVDAAALDAAVAAVIAETGAASVKDMGRVMKGVMARFDGQLVDGKLVSDRVRAALATS